MSSISNYSQQNDLAIKAKELVYSNPDEAIKIAEHILKTNHKFQDKAIANLLLSKSYFIKGNYNKVLDYAFDDINQIESIKTETRIENYLIKAKLLRKLYLDKQSQGYLNNASALNSNLKGPKKDSLQILIDFEHVNMLLDRLNTEDAVAEINHTKIRYKDFLKKSTEGKKQLFLAEERAFNNLSKYDSAFVYINKTLALIDSLQVNNLYDKAIIYKELGYLHIQNKELEKSEESLFIALRFAQILDNPFLLEQINRDLAITYLASNQNSKHQVYNDEFLILNNKIDVIEQESVNSVYNLIANHEEGLIKKEELKTKNLLLILLAVIIFITTIGLFIILKSENKKKRLKEIINYLEISRTNFIKPKVIQKPSTKRIAIPEETEQNLLIKLKKFENSHKFLNKDMSLAVLSGQFETNTKYLSEIINKHYNDNFNTFINKLRINYIIKKLKSDPNYINYKISFLAEECGFSAHSSFATVFKSIIGMSPATFINLLKIEREEIQNNKEA